MKRLMVLGTEDERRAMIAAARKESYEVIACCDDTLSQGDQGASKRLLMDSADQKEVLLAASRYGITGILGVGDEESLTASYTAQSLGLPGVPYAEARLLCDMILFRQFQEAHHFRAPQYCDISGNIDVSGLRFPMYIGPAEDTTMQHMVLVRNDTQLRRARDYALRMSPGRKVIAQESVDSIVGERRDGVMILATDLVVRGGALQPILWNECMKREEVWDPSPTGYLYPARIQENSRILLHSECTRLMALLGFQDAELGIRVLLVPGRTPYIISIHSFGRIFRLTELLSVLYRHDLLRDMVRLMVGDVPMVGTLQCPHERTYMAVYGIWVYRSGILRRVRLCRELQPYVLRGHMYVRQSAEIYTERSKGQALGCLFLRFKDRASMEEIMGRMNELIEIVMDDFEGSDS